MSEHITTYSGNDIYKQGKLEFKSISPSITVVFKGISGGPGRGFSMTYQVCQYLFKQFLQRTYKCVCRLFVGGT